MRWAGRRGGSGSSRKHPDPARSAQLAIRGRADGESWGLPRGRVSQAAGTRVAGVSYVRITPCAMKDWERWEDGEPEAPARLAGWSSGGGAMRGFAFDPARRE